LQTLSSISTTSVLRNVNRGASAGEKPGWAASGTVEFAACWTSAAYHRPRHSLLDQPTICPQTAN